EEAAQRITRGEYGHKVYAGGAAELGELSREFNAMSERLAERFSQEEEERQQLRTILGSMVEGVIAIDEQQVLLFANEKAAQFLEFHAVTAIGRKFWEVVRQKPVLALVDRAVASSTPQREELDWKGTGPKNLAVYVSPIQGRGAILVVHDTSEI